MSIAGRERVFCALDHRESDRTPLDFWAEKEVWERLLRDLALPNKRALLQRFQVDLRWMDHRYIGPDFSDPQGRYEENMWGERFCAVGDNPRVACGGSLDRAQTFVEIEANHWPSNDWVRHDHLREQTLRDRDFAILYGYADIWQRAAMVRGLDVMFIDMMERPEWAHYMTGKLTDFYREDWTRAMEASDGRIDLFFLISDLGTQRGPMMSLNLFRTFVKPRIQEMADLAHSWGKKLLYHSCGAVRRFIGDLIDAGVDILNPIQTSCAGMNPAELKVEYGDRLCFHGGVDLQTVLTQGTSQDVRRAVRDLIQAMKGNGGFILASSHSLLPEISTENIVAMYDEARIVG